MPLITVVGLASGRRKEIPFRESEKEENLLFWLRKKGVTIASSCDAEGVCKKCVIQDEKLSCEYTLETFLKSYPQGEVEISYL